VVTDALREVGYHLRWSLPLWAVQLLTGWLPENRISIRLRGLLAAPFFGRCGRGFRLASGVSFFGTSELEIGDDVYIARDCFLNCTGGIVLEDGVVLGPFVVLSTMQQVFSEGMVCRTKFLVRPIRVGRGTFLAAHTVVKCGTRIGTGSAIGANSTVVSDIGDHVLAAGVPAKVIGPIKERAPDAARVVEHVTRKGQPECDRWGSSHAA
jgi:acetyltransferase-like isoleucine patch superfamily enzyme